ncbi:MAG: EAL domain-containing protein [Butyrivibrio sp.]|nr:EAL domain-containing protein [Acetatifactor muris]MCM1558873.1 EAL domain-containing protein [Butyrivibrio sp.]
MNELHYQLDLLKAMNQKLTEKEKMYKRVFEFAEGAFLYQSFETNQIATFGQWDKFFDFKVRDTKDFSKILEIVEDAGAPELKNVLSLEKQGEANAIAECQLKATKGWLQFRTLVTYTNDGQPVDKVIYILNVTKARIQNEELTYMAYYDGLTGLYNRNYFVRLLTEYTKTAKEKNAVVSVMVLDIDEFRKVNDGMGIMVGDELVQQFGFFLKEICGDDMIACHLHSDVFCMAIYNPSGARSVDAIYREIQRRAKQPFHISSGQDINITVSIGVAEYPEAAASALELMNCAELVVFKCKKQGRNMLQYFDAPILENFLHSIELENKLKRAVFNNDFHMYYQPQYYTGNRRLRGVEALIRWKDADAQQMISPATFIPVAEKNGSIITIGRWVVEESIRQYAAWRKQFGFPFIMSINISALQYKREDFVDSIVGILNRYNVRPSEVELEITESVLIDDFKAVYDKLKILRNYGIRISLDDFGTGFSSLSYLKKLPIDTLKIDKSFIDTVLTDSTTRVITESIINMVKSLGFESIAEGVEEEQQYNYLHAIGCDVIQGYLFNKPLAPEELESMLAGGEPVAVV